MTDSDPKPASPDLYERFTPLLVANQPTIMGFIFALLPNASEAEDLLQKTSLIAWQKFEQFDPSTKFSTWACQIAYFEVKNHLRTRARDRHVFSDELLLTLADESVADTGRLADERAALAHCIKTLKADERDLLNQCYRPGTQIQQVAELFGRTRASVYKQLNRIRRRLLSCITLRIEQGGAA